jgi:hypothetical protein
MYDEKEESRCSCCGCYMEAYETGQTEGDTQGYVDYKCNNKKCKSNLLKEGE